MSARPLALLALLTLAPAVHAEGVVHESEYADRDRFGGVYARLQTGGFSGLLTVGVGYSALHDLVNVGASYGWVPPMNGAPTAHVGTFTATMRPLRFALSQRVVLYPLYTGGGLLIGRNVRSRLEVVEDQPNVRWGMLFFGAELALREHADATIVRHGLFIEEVTLGPYLAAVVNNSGMHVESAFSTALGYRATF